MINGIESSEILQLRRPAAGIYGASKDKFTLQHNKDDGKKRVKSLREISYYPIRKNSISGIKQDPFHNATKRSKNDSETRLITPTIGGGSINVHDPGYIQPKSALSQYTSNVNISDYLDLGNNNPSNGVFPPVISNSKFP